MDELVLRQLNGGEDEDEALRRALAMSMGETEGPSDEGDNSLPTAGPRGHVRSASTATTASTASSASASPVSAQPRDGNSDGAPAASDSATPVAAAAASSAAAGTSAPAPATSLLALDRKAMEAERLARRQKALEAQQAQTGTATAMSMKDDGAQKAVRPKVPHLKQPWQLRQTPIKRKAEDAIIVIDSDDDGGGGEDTTELKHDEKKIGKQIDGMPKREGKLVQQPPSRKRRLDDDDDDDIVAKKAESKATHTAPLANALQSSSGAGLGSSVSRLSAHLPYAKGVVKKTWVRGQQRDGTDITLDEIWQKNDLELAVLSSFQWDEEWLLAHLNIHQTRVMLIAFAIDDHQKERMKENARSSNIRFCFPPMQTMGYMHSKLQLLKFPGHLRIVVPTGNLVPHDWGETGTLENMVFLIDLPKLPKGRTTERASTSFLEDLSYFLTAQGVDAAMVQSLTSYDFSETARYAFVHSIAGSHVDEAWKRTGYSGLGRAVQAMGWASSKPIEADYITASIGSVSDDLIHALYYACQGDSGLKELQSRASRSRSTKGQSTIAAAFSATPPLAKGPRDALRLYFPTEETVENSIGGKGHAGTICFQKKWWESPTFPRKALRDAQSVRTGVLLHTKLLLVRTGCNADESQEGRQAACPRGWAYVGSANMSESAWGRMVKDRATGKTKITCRNWECGVLVPTDDESNRDSTLSSSMGEDAGMLDIFRRTVPVPIVVPGAKYIAEASGAEGKKPWFFLESY